MRAFNPTGSAVAIDADGTLLPAGKFGPVDPAAPEVVAAVEAGQLHLQADPETVEAVTDGTYVPTAHDEADLAPAPVEPDPPAEPELELPDEED